MTERTEAPHDGLCCAADCGKLGEFSVGVRVWGVNDPRCTGNPVELETSMLACADHVREMPSTAPDFFTLKTRQLLTPAMRAVGWGVPNYKSARWVHKPIERKPTTEVAH